mgnify:CR=1 FL=1
MYFGLALIEPVHGKDAYSTTLIIVKRCIEREALSQNSCLMIGLQLPLSLESIMTIEQTATETLAKVEQAATETVEKAKVAATETVEKAKATATKAKKAVETEVAKAEKLAEEVKASATEAVQKVSDRVQAESNTVVEKVKSLIAQLKNIEAASLLKEVQTNGYQALKNDYSLLRTAVVGNYETLQAKSSLKTFVNDLLAKFQPAK